MFGCRHYLYDYNCFTHFVFNLLTNLLQIPKTNIAIRFYFIFLKGSSAIKQPYLLAQQHFYVSLFYLEASLIRNYVSKLYYLAMKWIPPGNNVSQFRNAGKRITTIFSELLEQQFPIQYKTNGSLEKPLRINRFLVCFKF